MAFSRQETGMVSHETNGRLYQPGNLYNTLFRCLGRALRQKESRKRVRSGKPFLPQRSQRNTAKFAKEESHRFLTVADWPTRSLDGSPIIPLRYPPSKE